MYQISIFVNQKEDSMSIFKVFLFSLFLIGASVASVDYVEAKPTSNHNAKATKKGNAKVKKGKIKKRKPAKIKKFNGKKVKISSVGNSIKIEALGAKSAKVCCQKSCEGYNVSCHAYNCKKDCNNGCKCGGSSNSVYGEFIKR
jgi:hypothetical protein